jgi:hypothetical protein
MCIGLSRSVGDTLVAKGKSSSATVAVVDGDHAFDFVEFDRRSKVVPERLMPGRESLCLRADRSAGNCELTVLTVESAGVHVVMYWIDDTRVNARQQHSLVGRLFLRPGTERSENGTRAYPNE